MNVTRVPRETVIVCGQTALLARGTVVAFGRFEQVSVGDGAVPELLLHAVASVTAAAMASATVFTVFMASIDCSSVQTVLRQVVRQRALADAHQLRRVFLHA